MRAALDKLRLEGGPRYNAELVFEEVIANIIGHGAPDGHELSISVALEPSRDALALIFEDNGMPFDPRRVPDPPRQKSLEEARIGGYGLMLVRHAASSLDYLRTVEGHNRLTVRLQT
ncbi:MAG: ATP-binding protein [Gammaproteobacteria bacterium]|nr:ATP-binding protein [Gammaproteobacteria bacterium]